MDQLIFYSTVTLLSILTFIFPSKSNVWNTLLNGLTLLIVIYVFFNITYTSDWYNYEYMFDNIDDIDTDFLFRFSTLIADKYNYTFVEIYRFHILLIGILMIRFITYFTPNILLLSIIVIVYNYVSFANQIRYFFAFFLFLVATYKYIVDNKRLQPLILIVLSVLSHTGVIPLYFLLLFYNYIKKISTKKLLILIVSVSIALPLIIEISSKLLPQFSGYYSSEMRSSFAGGLLYILPVILIYILLIKKNASLIKNNDPLIYDSKYLFLYSLSILSILFVPVSFFYQIIMFRYIISMGIVWLILLVYVNQNVINNFYILLYVLAFSSLMILWFYFAPNLVGDYFYIKEAILMIQSTTV